MKQRLDIGPVTFLPMCDCGWRGAVDNNRERAWAQAHAHALNVHPGSMSETNWAYRLRARA